MAATSSVTVVLPLVPVIAASRGHWPCRPPFLAQFAQDPPGQLYFAQYVDTGCHGRGHGWMIGPDPWARDHHVGDCGQSRARPALGDSSVQPGA